MAAMKSVLDADDRRALAERILALRPDSPRQWGRMTPAQMLDHCTVFDRWVQGGGAERQTLAGRIVGKAMLRRFMRPDASLPKNVPTSSYLIGKDDGDFEKARQAWLSVLDGYADYRVERFLHDFFGPMSRDEVGVFVWKHSDHHLQQFGV